MLHLLRETLPLRRTASLLRISVSTAFRWRHRALAALRRQVRPLGGAVSVRVFLVKYSEKGSRVCNGPGSWGYWNNLRRGPHPSGLFQPKAPGGARRRFRLLIDGRPLGVMAAQTEQGYELAVIGQGRITPAYLAKGLAQLVKKGSHVYAPGWTEYTKACETLGLIHHNGWAALDEGAEATPGAPARDANHAPVWCPVPPESWLRTFKGVATRYLAHYLAWYRDIARPGAYPSLATVVASRAALVVARN